MVEGRQEGWGKWEDGRGKKEWRGGEGEEMKRGREEREDNKYTTNFRGGETSSQT